MSWFLLLKTLHVLSAITAVGANLTYGVWSALGKRDPAHLGFTLRGIKFVDDRLANPAYGVLLATGLIMTFRTYRIGLTWILIGLVAYVVLATVAAAGFTPTLRRQIAALDAGGPSSQAYRSAEARARGIGIFLGALVIAVVVVMVFKPQL
ncbi:MAG: DUF2269 domain-containing protein [Candidatus Dormibacteraeota bacterium]|nr:DUF2269 domain-containing protein [Candidatus Dormibacteraeota bacterium]